MITDDTTSTPPISEAPADAKSDTGDHQLSLRVIPSMVTRADALLDYVGRETGKKVNRSDVWREALVRGLRLLERARDGKTGGRE